MKGARSFYNGNDKDNPLLLGEMPRDPGGME